MRSDEDDRDLLLDDEHPGPQILESRRLPTPRLAKWWRSRR